MRAASAPGRLHVVTDEVLQDRYTHLELARMAARGGADVVQYREKRTVPIAERIRVADSIVESLRETGVDCVVDDHVEVALACGARGVHLGPGDLDPVAARRRCGPTLWIGGTANDVDAAIRLAGAPVDYLGVGPVFGTGSKSDPAPELGLEALARIATRVEKPIIAIGGITPETVAAVLETGVHGIAVLSAVVCREDPAAETARLREALERFAATAPIDTAAGGR